jgi:hypothetical protein
MIRKLPFFILTLFLLLFQPFFFSSLIPKADALTPGWECSISSIRPNPLTADHNTINSITINTNYAIPPDATNPGNKYKVYLDAKGGSGWVERIAVENITPNSSRQLVINTPFDNSGNVPPNSNASNFEEGTEVLFWVFPESTDVQRGGVGLGLGPVDWARKHALCEAKLSVGQGIGGDTNTSKCSIVASGEGLGKIITLKTSFTTPEDYNDEANKFYYIIKRLPGQEQLDPIGHSPGWGDYPYKQIVEDGITLTNFDDDHSNYLFDIGPYQVELHKLLDLVSQPICTSTFTVNESGINNEDDDYRAGQGLLACEPDTVNPNVYTCRTAIGEVSTDASGFIKTVLSLILGAAGAILLIVIILNGYKFMVSQGDPEKIKDAREGIIAAIMGIFLIIFSLTILSVITSNILGLPGFGG